MTDDRIALCQLVEKSADADLLLITRLVGAILLEQNDECAVQRARYMTLKTIAPLRDDLALMLPAVAA